jgi:two-component system, cell cycle response regulator DivK
VTSPPPEPGNPLVLIVDDNEKNRTLAGDVLRAAGFRTLEAGTAAEGIAIATAHLPDVILMDLQLPDMDGMEAARSLAEGTHTARIPVVVLSAHRLEGDDDRFRAAGFTGYLQKPIDVGSFAEQVRSLCGGRKG